MTIYYVHVHVYALIFLVDITASESSKEGSTAGFCLTLPGKKLHLSPLLAQKISKVLRSINLLPVNFLPTYSNFHVVYIFCDLRTYLTRPDHACNCSDQLRNSLRVTTLARHVLRDIARKILVDECFVPAVMPPKSKK